MSSAATHDAVVKEPVPATTSSLAKSVPKAFRLQGSQEVWSSPRPRAAAVQPSIRLSVLAAVIFIAALLAVIVRQLLLFRVIGVCLLPRRHQVRSHCRVVRVDDLRHFLQVERRVILVGGLPRTLNRLRPLIRLSGTSCSGAVFPAAACNLHWFKAMPGRKGRGRCSSDLLETLTSDYDS